MKKLVLLAPLIIVLLSSGCTVPVLNIEIPGLPDIPGFGPQVVQQEHDIIVIKSLEAVPDTIDSGQTAKIIAYIENIGDQPVPDVEVDLYDYCEGLYTPRIEICNTVIPYAEGVEKTDCKIDMIRPKEVVPVTWSVCQNRADPVKLRTLCPADGMKVLVRYHYTTSSSTTIELMSLEEMQRELIERTYVSSDSYIIAGQGPIKPYLTVEDKQPIPVFDVNPGGPYTNKDVTNARTVLKLQLKNMGSGQLDTRTTVNGKQVIAIPGSDIKVTGIGKNEDLVPATPESTECKFASSDWSKEPVKLIGKESSPYYCKIELSQLKDTVTRKTSRLMDVEVSYDYIITKSVNLLIDPKITG